MSRTRMISEVNEKLRGIVNCIINTIESETYVKVAQNTQYIKKNSLFENKTIYQPSMRPFTQCSHHT